VFVIKRTKRPPPTIMGGLAGPTEATHYAARVTPAGGVDEWADDRARALEIDGPAKDRVLAHYATRPNAGVVEAVDLTPPPPPPPPAPPPVAAPPVVVPPVPPPAVAAKVEPKPEPKPSPNPDPKASARRNASAGRPHSEEPSDAR
jgi:outer membrane biosynthesis protein TonB